MVDELVKTVQQVQEVTSPIPNISLISRYAFDQQGRLSLGPQAAYHALEALHHTAAGHLQLRKLLAKFPERFVATGERKLA